MNVLLAKVCGVLWMRKSSQLLVEACNFVTVFVQYLPVCPGTVMHARRGAVLQSRLMRASYKIIILTLVIIRKTSTILCHQMAWSYSENTTFRPLNCCSFFGHLTWAFGFNHSSSQPHPLFIVGNKNSIQNPLVSTIPPASWCWLQHGLWIINLRFLIVSQYIDIGGKKKTKTQIIIRYLPNQK